MSFKIFGSSDTGFDVNVIQLIKIASILRDEMLYYYISGVSSLLIKHICEREKLQGEEVLWAFGLLI